MKLYHPSDPNAEIEAKDKSRIELLKRNGWSEQRRKKKTAKKAADPPPVQQ